MNYVKSCLIITMLLGVGYSQYCDPVIYNCYCNQDTWQEYYNSEGHNMERCYLENANFYGADLAEASLLRAFLDGANLCNLAGSAWGECEESVTDNNGDGYDDVSYEVGYETGATSGDLNLDGGNDILDIVLLVNNILNP